MASARLQMNNCESLSEKLSPGKTTSLVPFNLGKIESDLTKKETNGLEQMEDLKSEKHSMV